MGPVPVVVANIDTKDAFEVSAPDDQEMVEQPATDGAYPPLGDRRSRSAPAPAS